MKLKILTLAAAVVIGLSAPAQAEMTKAEVETIIHDYLMNNADVILQAVNEYQAKSMQEQQQQALAANERKIYEHPLTPVAGNPDGTIRMVEFFDYNCGYCKRVIGDVQKVLENEKDVKLIFKEFPILGPTSETGARWALAAAKQDKYIEFHTRLLENQERVSDESLEALAKDLGLDVEKLKADAQAEEITRQINENRALAQELGINGTPGFIIEGQLFPGAMSYENMADVFKQIREDRKAGDTAE